MTLDHMIYHAQCDERLLTAPFSWLTYRLEPGELTPSAQSAIRIMKNPAATP